MFDKRGAFRLEPGAEKDVSCREALVSLGMLCNTQGDGSCLYGEYDMRDAGLYLASDGYKRLKTPATPPPSFRREFERSESFNVDAEGKAPGT